ncbi:DUF4132 domain-containing protein [Flavonifractor sp. An92]|uniref:DUF4132 domain-containing protein n=1 Tax=Flavonifractor sp. An92 TaxID=1965666 RepID=UPI001FA879AC|nr:DUF4132 domain-containing protein [Flavonifractor sp. An92]
MSTDLDFVIQDGVLEQYIGPGGHVSIPDGVSKIGWSAFSGCTGLISVTIPESVTKIGGSAFSGCTGLTNVTILAGMIDGWHAFYTCPALTEVTAFQPLRSADLFPEQACIRLDAALPFPEKPPVEFAWNLVLTPAQAAQCLMTQSQKAWKEAVWRSVTAETAQETAEALAALCVGEKKNKARDARLVEFLARYGYHLKGETADALKKCLTAAGNLNKREWVAEDSVVTGPASAFRELTFPDAVLVAPDALKQASGKVVRIGPENVGIGLDWLVRARISPKVKKLCVPAAWLISRVGEEGELPALSPDVTSRLVIEQAEKLRKTADIGRIMAIAQAYCGLSFPEALETYGGDLSTPRKVEVCRAALVAALPALPDDCPGTEEDFRRLLPEEQDRAVYRLVTALLFGVEEVTGLTFAASGAPAPAEAVETLLFRLCFGREDTWMGSAELRLLQLLNRSELTRFLETQCKVEGDGSWDAVAALPAVCILCGGRQAERLVRIYHDLCGRELYDASVRDQIKKGIERWLPYNENPDTLRAQLKSQELLCRAAKLRKMPPEELRALLLEQAETGLDDQGRMELDYGGRTFRVELLPDLTVSIRNEATGKTVRQLPKAGKEDDALHAKAANETFKELKSTVETLLRAQKDRLFQLFLSGDSIPAERWSGAYLRNPVLRKIVVLLVWSQNGTCFTLTQTGEAVEAGGGPYQLGPDPIGVAHPMEMEPGEAAAWQRYFAAHGLKQPFEQVWEPVVKFSAVREERYQGMKIPAYRFKGQEKHGISFAFDYAASELDITLDDCRLDYDGWGSAVDRHALNLQGQLTLGAFRLERRSRRANHIIGLLDKWTVEGRILKDDATAVEVLDSFTLAQVTELINLAIEHQCTNCTAALLAYKNDHFADFDPMDVFTLE